jgi:hypothetical protein
MSRDYRFVRHYADGRVGEALTLVCLDDADALLIAQRVGPSGMVEVWDGVRRVEASALESATPPIGPIPPPIDKPPGERQPLVFEALPRAQIAAPVPAAAPPAPDEPRAFNPFRRGAWRRDA